MLKKLKQKTTLILLLVISTQASAQPKEHSAARKSMDALLEAIRLDGFGPTIHARNIYHTAMAMYDAWAVFDDKASTYFLGKTVGGYTCEFNKDYKIVEGNSDSLRNIAITYAAYGIMFPRFNEYGSKGRTIDGIDSVFLSLGLDYGKANNTNYMDGSPEALGNYIAQQIRQFGLQDGANEEDRFENKVYEPSNSPIKPNNSGNATLKNPNKWQPISIQRYYDKRGGDKSLVRWVRLLILPTDIFLTPFWGEVVPFSLTENDRKVIHRDGHDWKVYMDPGPPPFIGVEGDSMGAEGYKWNFLLNAIWSSHMDPTDGVMIDISPRAIGATGELPTGLEAYKKFYNLMEGGTESKPHKINPYTKKPYEKNIVPRGDYTRVIAEYWVDAATTYTPPGHWFKTMESTFDSPEFEKKWSGKGKVMDDLEWDIKSFFVLAGTVHDAGIVAWSIKAYHDYVRPISAIRWMADNGQCSDKDLPRYHKNGIPLVKGKVELVSKNDPLVGPNKEHLNKIKLYAWRGPEYINEPKTDMAGVGWILAENWWPYQRFSFATPPFAGYVSGHSTFSKASAEALTLITGDPYFPGGINEITMKKNEFLEFEEGPGVDITLQWATYHDAADETCLSRIWGGIHPPIDDIPGRKIGIQIARKAFHHAQLYFEGKK